MATKSTKPEVRLRIEAAFSLFSVPMPIFEMPPVASPLPAMRHPVTTFPLANPVASHPHVMPVFPTMVARRPNVSVPRRRHNFHPIRRRGNLDVDVVACRLTGQRDRRGADRQHRSDDRSANIHGSSSKLSTRLAVVYRRHARSDDRRRCSQWTRLRLG